MALELRPECEHCGAALAPDVEAFIRSDECTFCCDRTAGLAGTCPSSGGERLRCPRRLARSQT